MHPAVTARIKKLGVRRQQRPLRTPANLINTTQLQLVTWRARHQMFERARSAPPPPCVTFRLVVAHGALDSHPFFPSHVASGRCFLSAAAAGAPAGVVSAFAEARGWCAGAVLDVACCAVWASAAPSSWRIGVVARAFDCCCPHTSVLRPSTTCLAAFSCALFLRRRLLPLTGPPFLSTTAGPPGAGSPGRRRTTALCPLPPPSALTFSPAPPRRSSPTAPKSRLSGKATTGCCRTALGK